MYLECLNSRSCCIVYAHIKKLSLCSSGGKSVNNRINVRGLTAVDLQHHKTFI